MDDKEAKRSEECFARLDTVFPMGADGLRHTPPECLACDVKTDCLRAALAGEHGSAVHEERLARAYEAGAVGFLKRWAQQKTFKRGQKIDAPWRPFWKRLRRNPRG